MGITYVRGPDSPHSPFALRLGIAAGQPCSSTYPSRAGLIPSKRLRLATAPSRTQHDHKGRRKMPNPAGYQPFAALIPTAAEIDCCHLTASVEIQPPSEQSQVRERSDAQSRFMSRVICLLCGHTQEATESIPTKYQLCWNRKN